MDGHIRDEIIEYFDSLDGDLNYVNDKLFDKGIPAIDRTELQLYKLEQLVDDLRRNTARQAAQLRREIDRLNDMIS